MTANDLFAKVTSTLYLSNPDRIKTDVAMIATLDEANADVLWAGTKVDQSQVRDAAYRRLNELGLLTSGKGVPYDAHINISTTDTAKIIRQVLKAAFPGFKFSVRSDKYAGGSSIHIGYSEQFDADKDLRAKLNELIKPYGSKGFDGMIDMGYYFTAWMLPSGRAVIAHTRGTQDSGGYQEEIDNGNPGGAQLVSFGASYVFAQRQF